MYRPGTLLALTVALVTSALGESPAPLRVMTFNIRNSNAKDGADHWEHRKELFAKTVRDFDPDLLGTQEVLADQFDADGPIDLMNAWNDRGKISFDMHRNMTTPVFIRPRPM